MGDIAHAVPGIRRRVDGEGHGSDEGEVDERHRRAALQHDEVRSGPGTEAQRQQSDQRLGGERRLEVRPSGRHRRAWAVVGDGLTACKPPSPARNSDCPCSP